LVNLRTESDQGLSIDISSGLLAASQKLTSTTSALLQDFSIRMHSSASTAGSSDNSSAGTDQTGGWFKWSFKSPALLATPSWSIFCPIVAEGISPDAWYVSNDASHAVSTSSIQTFDLSSGSISGDIQITPGLEGEIRT
jgi:hypothetical protein